MEHELSWFSRIKRSLKLDELTARLDLSRGRLIEMAVFLAVGFLVGILWKKYSNYVIAGFVFIGILILLQHMEIINIFVNWPIIQDFCGIQPQGDLASACWQWTRAHVLSLIMFFVGILIGVKVSE